MEHVWDILASQDRSEFLGLLALAALKATLLVAFAALLSLSLRRLSAATRHLLWASTLCAALLLPFLSSIHVLEVPIIPARVPAPEASAPEKSDAGEELPGIGPARRARDESSKSFESSGGATKGAGLQPGPSLPGEPSPAQGRPEQEAQAPKIAPSFLPRLVNWALVVWAAVVSLLLFRLLVGLTATRLLARSAVEFKDPALNRLFSSLLAEVKLSGGVRLLRSDRTTMPVVCGILRPAVLLPAEAEGWPEEQQRLVLLHELMHVARRDCLTQMIAQVACALYWFNPFVWAAARRLRVERERACDDYVLSVGTRPSDYARHLLEIARSMQERSVFEWSRTASVAMARRSQLEGRVRAILSKENRHRAASRAGAAWLLAVVCVLLVSLAVVRPTAINAEHTPAAGVAPAGGQSGGQHGAGILLTDSSAGGRTEIHAAAAGGAAGVPESTDAAGDGAREQSPTVWATAEVGEGGAQPGVALVAEQAAAATVALNVGPLAGQDQMAERLAGTQYGHDSKDSTQEGAGDFIDEMASVGFTKLSVDDLVGLKSAGVTADYVKSLRALGFASMTPREVVSLANHEVTPEYVRAIRAAGYNDLSLQEFITFRVHDITPEYIRSLRDAGYGGLTTRQLISFGVHEVTPSFIGGIRGAGYANLSADELVALSVHDITPEFIRKARSRLGELTIRQLVSLKNADIFGEDEDKEKSKDKDKDKEKEKMKDKGKG